MFLCKKKETNSEEKYFFFIFFNFPVLILFENDPFWSFLSKCIESKKKISVLGSRCRNRTKNATGYSLGSENKEKTKSRDRSRMSIKRLESDTNRHELLVKWYRIQKWLKDENIRRRDKCNRNCRDRQRNGRETRRIDRSFVRAITIFSSSERRISPLIKRPIGVAEKTPQFFPISNGSKKKRQKDHDVNKCKKKNKKNSAKHFFCAELLKAKNFIFQLNN